MTTRHPGEMLEELKEQDQEIARLKSENDLLAGKLTMQNRNVAVYRLALRNAVKSEWPVDLIDSVCEKFVTQAQRELP
jgi:hypothetical protein